MIWRQPHWWLCDFVGTRVPSLTQKREVKAIESWGHVFSFKNCVVARKVGRGVGRRHRWRSPRCDFRKHRQMLTVHPLTRTDETTVDVELSLHERCHNILNDQPSWTARKANKASRRTPAEKAKQPLLSNRKHAMLGSRSFYLLLKTQRASRMAHGLPCLSVPSVCAHLGVLPRCFVREPGAVVGHRVARELHHQNRRRGRQPPPATHP